MYILNRQYQRIVPISVLLDKIIIFQTSLEQKSHMGKITCGENWCQKRPSGMFPARQKKRGANTM